MSKPTFVRINADAALDAQSWRPGPVSAVIECSPFTGSALPAWPADVPAPIARGQLSIRLFTPGQANEFLRSVPIGLVRIHDRPGRVLMPGLVNAHTHLDLTHLGPFPQGRGSFGSFFPRVREGRLDRADDIAHSVSLGINLCLSAGVVAVGDIAGCPPEAGPSSAPFFALAASPLRGVSYLEFFAIGTRESQSLARLECVWETLRPYAGPSNDVRAGLHPHAPYSVSLAAYARAVDLAARDNTLLSTHLAESPAEHELIARASGPFRAFLESLGLWSQGLLDDFGHGNSPVEHLRPILERANAQGIKPLVVHLNDLSERDGASLSPLAHAAYCPRSSSYFETERAFGPHRYRTQLLGHGVPVCLGTDSILNVPGPALSPLDDARMLSGRDATDPLTLAAMLTTHGALALGLDAERFRFGIRGSPAPLAGLVSVPTSSPTDPSGVFHSDGPAELLAIAR